MVFQCINIRQVPWEVLKTATSGLGFQHLPRDLANVNSWKTMFDPYIVDMFENKSKSVNNLILLFCIWPLQYILHRQLIRTSNPLSWLLVVEPCNYVTMCRNARGIVNYQEGSQIIIIIIIIIIIVRLSLLTMTNLNQCEKCYCCVLR